MRGEIQFMKLNLYLNNFIIFLVNKGKENESWDSIILNIQLSGHWENNSKSGVVRGYKFQFV